MNEFFNIALAFPTLPLSILVGFILIYWLLACTGLVDSDAAEGGWLDPDVGDLIEAGSHGHGHGDHHPLASASLAGLMSRLGLATVPVMVTASLVILFMWGLTYYAHMFLIADLNLGVRLAAGAGIILLTFILSVLAAAAVLKPVRWFLRKFTSSTSEEKEIRGKEGLVVSAVVDSIGGRISVDDGGAGLILNARSLSGDTLPRNASVVVVAQDAQTGLYEVVLKEEFYKL